MLSVASSRGGSISPIWVPQWALKPLAFNSGTHSEEPVPCSLLHFRGSSIKLHHCCLAQHLPLSNKKSLQVLYWMDYSYQRIPKYGLCSPRSRLRGPEVPECLWVPAGGWGRPGLRPGQAGRAAFGPSLPQCGHQTRSAETKVVPLLLCASGTEGQWLIEQEKQ